jgi:hypothetical protein
MVTDSPSAAPELLSALSSLPEPALQAVSSSAAAALAAMAWVLVVTMRTEYARGSGAQNPRADMGCAVQVARRH